MVSQDLVAIIGKDVAGTCVWTVDVGPVETLGFSRLTGAWIVANEEVRTLHFWPQVTGVICSSLSWTKFESDLEIEFNRLEVADMVSLVESNVATLQKTFEEKEIELRLAKKGGKLIAPRWPNVPRLQISTFTSNVKEATKQEVLEASWWVKNLCDRWSDIEEIRLARSYMREMYGETVRPQPWARPDTDLTLF